MNKENIKDTIKELQKERILDFLGFCIDEYNREDFEDTLEAKFDQFNNYIGPINKSDYIVCNFDKLLHSYIKKHVMETIDKILDC